MSEAENPLGLMVEARKRYDVLSRAIHAYRELPPYYSAFLDLGEAIPVAPLASDEIGRAELFSEADPLFSDMLRRGIEFINYLARWDGGSPLETQELGQQGRLGIARAAFRAFARHPTQEQG